jgi:hypothetical protein
MTKIGIIARADKTGLGYQTKELVEMLNPTKVMLIDSSHFNGNEQFPEWYDGYDVKTSQAGFLSNMEVNDFLNGIDVVISCEIFYNTRLSNVAYRRGIKTILQYNYEFFEYFVIGGMREPSILLGPTTWNIDIMQKHFTYKSSVHHQLPQQFLKRLKKQTWLRLISVYFMLLVSEQLKIETELTPLLKC